MSWLCYLVLWGMLAPSLLLFVPLVMKKAFPSVPGALLAGLLLVWLVVLTITIARAYRRNREGPQAGRAVGIWAVALGSASLTFVIVTLAASPMPLAGGGPFQLWLAGGGPFQLWMAPWEVDLDWQPIHAYIMDSDGRHKMRVSKACNAIERFWWSPRGDRLAFFAQFTSPDYSRHHFLNIVDQAGRTRLRLPASTSPASTGHAAWSPDGRQFKYRSPVAESPWLVVQVEGAGGTAPTGEHALPVPSEPTPATCAGYGGTVQWSPDGKRLLLTCFSGNSSFVSTFCFLRVDDTAAQGQGARTHPVLEQDGKTLVSGSRPAWSPDGKWIAFEDGWGICMSRADGHERKRLTDEIKDECRTPTWSPDGRDIAFVTDFNLPKYIWLVNCESGETRRLAEASEYTSCSQLSWSPDGRRLLFLFCRGTHVNEMDLHVVDITSGEIRKLTNSPGYFVKHFAWSPDGRHIAYTSTDANYRSTELLVMNSDGTGRPQLLRREHEEIMQPAWSPDGRRLAFVCDRAVQVMNADGTHLTDFGTNRMEAEQPAWSPDGRWIACISRRPRYLWGEDVWLVSPDGTVQRNLTHQGLAVGEGSPALDKEAAGAGRRYALIGKEGAQDIWATDRDGISQRNLTNCPGEYGGIVPSPDGALVLFSRSEPSGKKCGLYVMTADGERQLRLAAGAHAVWSPDSRRIAVIKGYPSQIAVINADGTGLLENLSSDPPPYWAPAGSGGKAPTWSEPAWSPDGRRLAYAYQGQETPIGGQAWPVLVLLFCGILSPLAAILGLRSLSSHQPRIWSILGITGGTLAMLIFSLAIAAMFLHQLGEEMSQMFQ